MSVLLQLPPEGRLSTHALHYVPHGAFHPDNDPYAINDLPQDLPCRQPSRRKICA